MSLLANTVPFSLQVVCIVSIESIKKVNLYDKTKISKEGNSFLARRF